MEVVIGLDVALDQLRRRQATPGAIGEQRGQPIAHGLLGASAFRAEVNRLDSVDAVESAVNRFFAQAEGDASAANDDYDVDYRQALG